MGENKTYTIPFDLSGNKIELGSEISAKPHFPIPFKKDPLEFNQLNFNPKSIFDYLPDNHDCFIYRDIFNQFDFSQLNLNYSPKGQRAYSPKLICGILIYAYCHGVYTSRQIELRCHTDLGFMFISRMNCPNFRVLSDFRKRNIGFFEDLFTKSVSIAIELNLVSLENVSQDGSKFKANTSKHKAMSYGYMKKSISELSKIINELLQKIDQYEINEENDSFSSEYIELKKELDFKEKRLEKILRAKNALEAREEQINPGKTIPDKSQISFADTDARIMGKNGSFDYSYNGQICVDSQNQIIVSQYVSQKANDKREVEEGILRILWNIGRLPNHMTYDNGYFSGYNLEIISKYQVNAFIAVGREGKEIGTDIEKEKQLFKKEDFIYQEIGDYFVCPAGNHLHMIHASKDGKKKYSCNEQICNHCKFKERCSRSLKGKSRTLSTDNYEELRKEMRQKMSVPYSKEIYAKRKTIVEPVFGQVKNSGFREFHLRSYKNVKGEFSLVCLSHNLKKVCKFIINSSKMTGNTSCNNHIVGTLTRLLLSVHEFIISRSIFSYSFWDPMDLCYSQKLIFSSRTAS